MKRSNPPKNPPKQDKAERKQVGIHIDVQLWRKFRARCLEEGIQAGHKVEELVRDYLKKEGKS